MYMIGTLKDGKNIDPLLNSKGRIRKFKTGKNAAKAARAAERALGVKVQPRPLATEDWRERERAKFAREEYKRIKCWASMRLTRKGKDGIYQTRLWCDWYPDHFAHVSVTKKAMVAYIPDETYGVTNRKLIASPGSYLQKYFPELCESDVTYWARNFGAMFDEIEVKFATEPKDIARVYMRGPNSCMSGAIHKYCASPHHPTEVYGAGDLALAYLEQNGAIAARGLVWPEKKIYGRIYGDRWRLEQALINRNYVNAYDGADFDKREAWIGAKLLKLKSKDGMHVMPYLDFVQSVTDGGEHWLVGRNGWGCGNTNGLLLHYHCCICNEICTPADADDHDPDYPQFHWHENRPYCRDCFEERYAQCEYTGNWHPRSEMVEVQTGHGGSTQWHNAIFRQYGFRCALSGERFHLQWRVTLTDGRHASSRHLPDNAVSCSARRDIWHIPDVTKCPSGINCCQISDEMRAEIKKKEEAAAKVERSAEVVASVGPQTSESVNRIASVLLSSTTIPADYAYLSMRNAFATDENDGEYHDEND